MSPDRTRAGAQETIPVGAMSVRFLVQAADSNGSVSVFECFVPADSRMPAPHSHDAFEETIYGLEGVTSWTVDGRAVEIGVGDAFCVPRGAVHGFQNTGAQDAKFLAVATPGVRVPTTSVRSTRSWRQVAAALPIPPSSARSCAGTASRRRRRPSIRLTGPHGPPRAIDENRIFNRRTGWVFSQCRRRARRGADTDGAERLDERRGSGKRSPRAYQRPPGYSSSSSTTNQTRRIRMDRRTPILAVVAGLAVLAPAASAAPGDVVNKAEANFPTLATAATVEKIEGKEGLDLRATGSDGRPVDIEALLDEDRAKQRDAFGALDAPLARHLDGLADDERVPVAIWLVEPERPLGERPEEGAGSEDVDKLAELQTEATRRPGRRGDDPVPGATPPVRRAGRRVDLEPARVGHGAGRLRPRAGEGRAGRHDLRRPRAWWARDEPVA